MTKWVVQVVVRTLILLNFHDVFINILQTMSNKDLSSRKSRYTDKYQENSSLCNRSVKSNNLSVDLPQNRKKYSKIEHELLSRYNAKGAITINLANTKYPILQQVCGSEGFNWKVQNFGQTKNWHIKWCDTGVINETLQRMAHTQRINHFPSMSVISRKNTLALTLAKMKDQFPQDYDYYPRTFLYPNDSAKIYHYFSESRKRGLLKTFIVKPEAGCQGRGIYLTQNPADFQKQQRCVIQKYVSNPLLYKGLKFDLRIYVLLACCNPLRIYLYNEGLVRFATEAYELPDQNNLNNFYMHLTNYAINKSNPNYQYNYSVNDMTHGHKQSLAEFFKNLKDEGYRANLYWSQIKDNIIKTVIAAQPYLLSNYKLCRPQESTNNMCFELLGFDFMMDNQDRVYLLQVNHTPSFSTDTPLDHIIKKNLIKDTLLMMNATQEELKYLEDLERIKQREKFIKFKNVSEQNFKEKQEITYLINQVRMQNQNYFKGTYQMIFPHKNPEKQNKYDQFIHFAMKTLNFHSTPSTNVSSAIDIRGRLKQGPKSKLMSKQQLSKMVPETKKNIIYNYNNIKHPISSSKKLQTLPAQRLRADSQPRQKFNTSTAKSSFLMHSKEKLKTEGGSSTRDIRSIQPSYKSQEKRTNYQLIDKSKPRGKPTNKISQDKQTKNELNNFSNRIRAYKTPFMS